MSFLDKIRAREPGACLYGLAPPKRSTERGRLEEIAKRQVERLRGLEVDGLVVYDIQDESTRISEPRPFPFLPTLDPEAYVCDHLAGFQGPKIVYRCVGSDSPEQFLDWIGGLNARREERATVLVGTPASGAEAQLPLAQAYELAQEHAPELAVGGIAIAERHVRRLDEHERLLSKMDSGCRFFVTQAVYDITATKSLLSDYRIALEAAGREPVPLCLTFAPCASERTLAFMKWLGISFPRWLENELLHAKDALTTSLGLCEVIFEEAYDYATSKGIPLGVNVESVSIRKAEIEASVELLKKLRAKM